MISFQKSVLVNSGTRYGNTKEWFATWFMKRSIHNWAALVILSIRGKCERIYHTPHVGLPHANLFWISIHTHSFISHFVSFPCIEILRPGPLYKEILFQRTFWIRPSTSASLILVTCELCRTLCYIQDMIY